MGELWHVFNAKRLDLGRIDRIGHGMFSSFYDYQIQVSLELFINFWVRSDPQKKSNLDIWFDKEKKREEESDEFLRGGGII